MNIYLYSFNEGCIIQSFHSFQTPTYIVHNIWFCFGRHGCRENIKRKVLNVTCTTHKTQTGVGHDMVWGLHTEKLCKACEDAPWESFQRKCLVIYCWKFSHAYTILGTDSGFMVIIIEIYIPRLLSLKNRAKSTWSVVLRWTSELLYNYLKILNFCGNVEPVCKVLWLYNSGNHILVWRPNETAQQFYSERGRNTGGYML
jgi:hypothetical protein